MVLNRERPVYVIVNPADYRNPGSAPRGRPLREALSLLESCPLADADFGRDMEAVLGSVVPIPEDPWARS